MPANVCEECLTLRERMVVVFEGDTCRFCGHTPVRGILTPREIRTCISSWGRQHTDLKGMRT